MLHRLEENFRAFDFELSTEKGMKCHYFCQTRTNGRTQTVSWTTWTTDQRHIQTKNKHFHHYGHSVNSRIHPLQLQEQNHAMSQTSRIKKTKSKQTNQTICTTPTRSQRTMQNHRTRCQQNQMGTICCLQNSPETTSFATSTFCMRFSNHRSRTFWEFGRHSFKTPSPRSRLWRI